MSGSVVFRNVSKAFRLGESRRSLREALSQAGRRLRSRAHLNDDLVLWALKDVSFELRPGGILGIIGPNGAGKTTILKLISRITQPTSGGVYTSGRVSALIELGAGFHPDLSGRENIYLNAAILGMPLKEVDRRFDEIVGFSGLERFLDTPVKRYSSGMYVRLAFSVAAHVTTEILLVDEVLAVGDAGFRQRCLQRIRELRRNGVTILFVSHNLYLVESVCDQCLFLAGGQVQASGHVSTVLNAYEDWRQLEDARLRATESEPGSDRVQSEGLIITAVEVRNRTGAADEVLRGDELAEIAVHFRAGRCVRRPNLYLKIIGDAGTCCMIRTADYGIALGDLDGQGVIRVAMDPLQLTPGMYAVHAELLEDLEFVVLAEGFSSPFRVAGRGVGHEGVFVPRVGWARVDPVAPAEEGWLRDALPRERA